MKSNAFAGPKKPFFSINLYWNNGALSDLKESDIKFSRHKEWLAVQTSACKKFILTEYDDAQTKYVHAWANAQPHF